MQEWIRTRHEYHVFCAERVLQDGSPVRPVDSLSRLFESNQGESSVTGLLFVD